MKKEYLLPKGFKSSGIHAGIKKGKSLDAGLIYSDTPCEAAAFFTRNRLKSAHILHAKKILKNNIRAVFANSGSANALTGKQGIKDLEKIIVNLSKLLKVKANTILGASTGKICKLLPVKSIIENLILLTAGLSGKDRNFPKAIMTTDTKVKTVSETLNIAGKKCIITAAAKGAGMISPDMATMLVFTMTDVNISKPMLKAAAYEAIKLSFNRITVDGDMSPNDTVYVLANARAQNKKISGYGPEYEKFKNVLCRIFYSLADDMVSDGEGTTKLIKINIKNAKDIKQAEKIARQIANSPLVKCMFFGESINPGRIISALGQTFEPVDINKIALKIGNISIISGGGIILKNYNKAGQELKKKRIEITLDLKAGRQDYYLLTTDLSVDYVKINADYS